MKEVVYLTITLIVINVITCYDAIFQEDTRDLNNYLDEEVERIVKNDFRAVRKRNDVKSEVYEGSGDYQSNVVRKPYKPKKGLKGKVQASMYNYNSDNDFEFENETNNRLEETKEAALPVTILSSTVIPTTKTPERITQSTTSSSSTTTSSSSSSTTTSSSSSSTTASTSSTESTKSPNCNQDTCSLIWANYTVVIEPKHITAIEGSNYELKCLLRDDETKNLTLLDGSKVVWTVNLDENNEKEMDSYYKIPEWLRPEYIGTENQIVLFGNATEANSGAYLCVILLPDKCCEKKKLTLVRIYKKPDYALHLIITGAICGVQLIACIPFALYTRRRMYAQHNLDIAETEDEQKLIA